jgi:hypothetical protein
MEVLMFVRRHKDEAVDQLMATPKEILASTVQFMHQNVYGTEGAANIMAFSVPELVSWVLSHYEWDFKEQAWAPMTGEETEDLFAGPVIELPTEVERVLH